MNKNKYERTQPQLKLKHPPPPPPKKKIHSSMIYYHIFVEFISP